MYVLCIHTNNIYKIFLLIVLLLKFGIFGQILRPTAYFKVHYHTCIVPYKHQAFQYLKSISIYSPEINIWGNT